MQHNILNILFILQIFSISINFIGNHRFGIIPSTLHIGLHGLDQGFSLIKGFPARLIDPSVSIDDAYGNLSNEFCSRCFFAPYNGTDMWLTDTDNSLFDRVDTFVIHAFLLVKEFLYGY